MLPHVGHYVSWLSLFVDITTNLTNVNLYNHVLPQITSNWSTSGKKLRLFITIKSGAIISSTSSVTPALLIPPDVSFGGVGGFRSYDQLFLTIEPGAEIQGCGGAGGLGTGGIGSNGGAGGTALRVQRSLFMNNQGWIRGGGGGGGSGAGGSMVTNVLGWACTKQGQNPNYGFNQTQPWEGCTTFSCCAEDCGGANAVGTLPACTGFQQQKLGSDTNFVCMTCGVYAVNSVVNGCNGGAGQGVIVGYPGGGSCVGGASNGGAGGSWGSIGSPGGTFGAVLGGLGGTGGYSINGISNVSTYNAPNTGNLNGGTI
jgi:hypothetical protein